MVVWLFRLYDCFLLGSTERKVRFTLVSGAVGAGMSVSSAGGASASHGESGFWKNRADSHTARPVKLVFPNGTVQGYYKSEQEAEESLAFFKKNNMYGKDCRIESSLGALGSCAGDVVARSGVRTYARTFKGKLVGFMPAADLGQSNKNKRSLSADLFGAREVPVNASFGELEHGELLGRSAGAVPAGRQMLPNGRSRLVYPGDKHSGGRAGFSDLRSGVRGGTVSSRGDCMGTVISSAISFQKIFSMAKIKNPNAIPDYVELAVANNGAPCNDGWFGDVDDAEECTKFVCQYVAGGASFFFCFGRDPNASLMEAPSGDAFQFYELFAKRGNDWFSKRYPKEELKAVIDVINSSEDAVSDLGMEPSSIRNPLNSSAGSVGDYQEGKLE